VQASYLDQHSEVVAVSSNFAAFDSARGVFDTAHAARYYAQIRRNGLQGIFGGAEPFSSASVAWWCAGVDAKYDVYSGRVWKRLVFGNFMHPPTLMLRRSARQGAGWLRKGIQTAEDWDYILRLAHLGPIALIDAPLLKYRCHDQQMSASNDALSASSCLRVVEWARAEHGELLTDARKDIDAALAKYHAQAAYALAGHRPFSALRHLLEAARLDRKRAMVAHNLARILAGSRGLRLYRKLRGPARHPSAPGDEGR
jgi:hypothetical protein